MNKAEEIQQAIRILGFAARQAADDWVRSSGLTRQQAFTLGYIERQQDRGVMAREIAEMSGTTAASVASLIQGLEDRGYLTRTPSPKDSRVKLLRVTPAAAQLVDGFGEAMQAAQEHQLDPLSPDEQDQLLALLQRLTRDIEIPDAPPPPERGERRHGPF
jgi:DNA-binding MarR family transcriptional regulator